MLDIILWGKYTVWYENKQQYTSKNFLNQYKEKLPECHFFCFLFCSFHKTSNFINFSDVIRKFSLFMGVYTLTF